MLTSIFLSLPFVQTNIAKRATNYLNETFNTHIFIDEVHFMPLLGDVSIKGVYIEDYKQDTLAYINKLNTSLLSLRNVIKGDLEFGEIRADELLLNLKIHKGEDNTNLNVFVDKLDKGEGDPNNPFLMTASQISVNKSEFRLVDENKETPLILGLEELHIEADYFKILGPKVDVGVDELDFTSKKGVVVNRLQTDFSYTKTQMRLDSLSIETPESFIKGAIIFDYEVEDFKDFLNKVKVSGNFKESTVALDEINLYFNEFGQGRKVELSSDFEGVLNELNTDNLKMNSQYTSIDGDFVFNNMFEKDKPFSIDAHLRNVSSNYYQLTGLLPGILGNALPSAFNKLGQLSVFGNMRITEKSVYAKVNLISDIGKGFSDLTLTDIDNIDNANYQGVLSLQDFNIGTFLEDETLGQTSLDLNVDGQGFKQESLNTEIIGEIFSVNYNGYEYKNLKVSGILKDQLFDGSVTSKDENFDVTFKGLADLSGDTNTFKFVASVNKIDLNRLNFVERDSISVFKGNIVADMSGNSLYDLEGDVSFYKTNYVNQNDSYYFDDFNITSEFKDEDRIITVNSPDIITGSLEGKYKLQELPKLVKNSVGSIYTNYQPEEITPGQNVDFNFKIYNKIVEVFYPKIEFGSNTSIRGSIVADEGDFKLAFNSPKINANGNIFDNIQIQIDNKNPLYNTYVEVKNIESKIYDVNDFSLINTKINDTLFFRTEFKGGKEFNDVYNLNFYHTFNNAQESVIGLKRSQFGFKGRDWVINEANNANNKVSFSKTLDTINISQVVMNYNEEQIRLEGTLIDSTYKDVDLEFEKVTLNKILPHIDSLQLDGKVDGYLNILQRNSNYTPSSNVKISNFTVNDLPLGNLFLSILGNDNLTQFGVNAKIVNNDVESLNILGNINAAEEEAKLDLRATLENLNLSALSPLGGDVISNMRGYASGGFKITGNADNPEMAGNLQITDGGLKIPYLNIDVAFDKIADVTLEGRSFKFNEIGLTDTSFKTRANLNGSITYDHFEDWYLDLYLDTKGEKFLVLNTKGEEESLYYGTGFISGQAQIYGLTNEMINIDVDAKTEKGTNFVIPVSDITEVGDISFINFIDKNESEEDIARKELAEVKGVEMQFDLDVTPDAQIEIVVDQKTRSTLRGTGAGNLLIEINTNGKFKMYGDFITYTGEYLFKYGGFINKRFVVEPGGTIVWEGDPLEDVDMNIAAKYSLYANPAVLLDNAQLTRKIETDVIITLQGQLLKPSLEYEIKFPSANAVINQELQYHLDDNAKRELQAFSLLSQGVFLNQLSISQTAVTGNLAQTASSLFNQVLNAGDGKFDVGVSYEIGERNPDLDFITEDRLGVTVSTQISDRILINGKVGVPVGGVSETVVAGDVEIQVLLNEEGSLTARIFNRENEIQQFFAQQQGYTQGVGISYQVEFDTFRELMKKIIEGDPNKETNKIPTDTDAEDDDSMGNGLVNFKTVKRKESS
ncbi:translocation/assembly module TamB domain-containing protein [Galbibacter mesophilus]|uniref:translocation/assembly module TamB domain-containing protein n=1 Tax=Galbibacter mesophilus TaxID=379069 RepID=UPI002043D5A8|nr:translocation/assembly module TamB domain-containing protein [Galbibacter mesophilus]MCM5663749.1 translocation/assembly module TamB [Galbibacter mesophilus]